MAEGTLPETITPNDDDQCHQSSGPDIWKFGLSYDKKLINEFYNSALETDKNSRKEKLRDVYDSLKQQSSFIAGPRCDLATDQLRHLEEKYGDDFIELAHDVASCFPNAWWKKFVRNVLKMTPHLKLKKRDLASELQSLVAHGGKKLQEVYQKFENLQQVDVQLKSLAPINLRYHSLGFRHDYFYLVDEIPSYKWSGKDGLIDLVDEIINYSPDPDWKNFASGALNCIIQNFVFSEENDLPYDILEVALVTNKDEISGKLQKLLHRYRQLEKARESIGLWFQYLPNHEHSLRKPVSHSNFISSVNEIINYSSDLNWKSFVIHLLRNILERCVSSEEEILPDDLLEAALVTDEDARSGKLHKLLYRYQQLEKAKKFIEFVGWPNSTLLTLVPYPGRSPRESIQRLQYLKLISRGNFISLANKIINFSHEQGWKEFTSNLLKEDEYVTRHKQSMKDPKLQLLCELLNPSNDNFENDVKEIAKKTNNGKRCRGYYLQTVDDVFHVRDHLKNKCNGDLRQVFYRAISVIPDENWKEFVRVTLGLSEADIGDADTLSREKKFGMLLTWSEQQKQKTGQAPTTDEFLNILVDFLDEKDLVDGVLEQLLKSEKAKEKLQKIVERDKMKLAMQELKETCGGKRNKAFYKAIDLVLDGNWKEFVRVYLDFDEDEIRKYHFDNLSRERKYEMLQAWAKQVKKTTGKEPEADEFLDILGEFLTPLGIPVQNIFIERMVNQTYEEVNAQNFNGLVKNCTHCK